MQLEYKNDIALLKLTTEIENRERVLPICRNFLPPFEAFPRLLGFCGKGTISTTHYDLPYKLQETFFHENNFESNTQPVELRMCRGDKVCVESVTPGLARFSYLPDSDKKDTGSETVFQFPTSS